MCSFHRKSTESQLDTMKTQLHLPTNDRNSAFPLQSPACRIRMRLYSGMLVLLMIGCQTTQTGDPNTSPAGATTLLTFAPPGQALYVHCYGAPNTPYNGVNIILDPTPSLNNTDRPPGIPANYVAYASTPRVFGTDTYTGDLMSGTPGFGATVVDEVDAWNGSTTRVLIKE